jgi:predicted glutamine amidotransferase
MCQLLGMNCNPTTDISLPFEGFRTRDRLTDVHKDGWSVVFFEGPGCGAFLDVERQAPFAVAHLKGQDVIVNFSEVANSDDRVAVIATALLADHRNWIALAPGTLTLLHEDMPLRGESAAA